jgi:hypothetical protein
MHLNPYNRVDPPPASPVGKVLRSLAYLGSYAAAIGLVVSFGRRGEPLWPDGRLLLVAAGVAFLAYGAWTSIWRPPEEVRAKVPLRWTAVWLMLLGLGMVGGGVDHLDPGGPWLLLCAPLGAVTLWYAWYMGEQEDEADGKNQAGLAILGLAALVIAATEFI